MNIFEALHIASEYVIIAASTSTVRMTCGALLSADRAILEVPLIELYGSILTKEQCVFNSLFVILRGSGMIYEESELKFDSTTVIFDSFDMASFQDVSGGLIPFGNNTGNLNITNGTTPISAGSGGQFDLDGPSNMAVNIDADSELVIDVEFIERFGSQY